MNAHPEHHGFDERDRRSRLEGALTVGDAIGNMIIATVFGLTRAVDELNLGAGGATGSEYMDADPTRGRTTYR